MGLVTKERQGPPIKIEPIDIELTPLELAVGAFVGALRQRASLERPDAYGRNSEKLGWNDHIEGACGEIAAAKALRRYWEPTYNVFKDPDIRCPDLGYDIQVRTRSRNDRELYIRPDDPDGDAYLLVTGKAPHFKVWGYRFGIDRKEGRWDNPGNRPYAWFFPHDKLFPWQELVVNSTPSTTPVAAS